MRKLITASNIIIAIGFLIVANIFFWLSILAIFATLGETTTEQIGNETVTTTVQPSWLMGINILLAPFLVYGTIMFFRKTKKKYKYGLTLLGIIAIIYLVFPMLTEKPINFSLTDLGNILFFIVPMVIIYLVKVWDDKFTVQETKLGLSKSS